MNTITNIKHIEFGNNSIDKLELTLLKILDINELTSENFILIFMDIFFKSNEDLIIKLKSINCQVEIYFVDSSKEPSTNGIDDYKRIINQSFDINPSAIIGIGGGVVLDTSKAVSNILNNPGKSSEYQGWDLLQNSGIPKIGIPTVSGTGAESSRTCVLTNKETGLKLGMNSDFTIFDALILDPHLTSTVPKEVFFFTLFDAFFHSFEPLSGRNRNLFGDAYASIGLNLSTEILLSHDLLSEKNRSNAMLASYFGGLSVANGMTTLVHPISAALGVVFSIPHTYANCLALSGLEEFFPEEYKFLFNALERHNIKLTSVTHEIDNNILDNLYNSTIVHEKPLSNYFGESFKEIFNKSKGFEVFKSILT